MFKSKETKILTIRKHDGKEKTENQNEIVPKIGPRYPKPKVLLIDLPADSAEVLKNAGYNVHCGTFGTPYRVTRANSYQALPLTYRIPNYAEQEIILIDLTRPVLLTAVPLAEQPVEGDYAYWGKCNSGTIDPRPIASRIFRTPFDTIHSHGGVFVVFADLNTETEIVYARDSGRSLESPSAHLQLWSFLECVDPKLFQTEFFRGNEITVVRTNSGLAKLLSRHLDGAEFHCVFAPKQYKGRDYSYNKHFDRWEPLAIDKYGSPVAGMFRPREDDKGFVVLLPQLARKSQFLLEFLRDVLPDLTPSLFPYSESNLWIDHAEYQSAAVLELRRQIQIVEIDANAKITSLKQLIDEEKERTKHLMQLLTETGDVLVQAVKKTLEELGFTSIIDADEEIKATGTSTNKKEDLRLIVDNKRLLIEIKGITGLPTDADALQVQKYVVVRMREWNDTKIQGLEIINHQKGIPPLGREHEKPFRDDILVNAEEQYFGLMTTWDLFRLARSYFKLKWKHEFIESLLLLPGRIQPLPNHYELVGIVEHFWERVSAVGIRMQSGNLVKGDRIAYEMPIEFEEQLIESLQVDNQTVESAQTPALIGVRTAFTKQQLKSGTRVYRVRK